LHAQLATRLQTRNRRLKLSCGDRTFLVSCFDIPLVHVYLADLEFWLGQDFDLLHVIVSGASNWTMDNPLNGISCLLGAAEVREKMTLLWTTTYAAHQKDKATLEGIVVNLDPAAENPPKDEPAENQLQEAEKVSNWHSLMVDAQEGVVGVYDPSYVAKETTPLGSGHAPTHSRVKSVHEKEPKGRDITHSVG
jgi:hypothetical protein